MAEVRLEDLKGNSNKRKEAIISEKKPVKTIKADIVSTHKSLGEKFIDTFMSETVDDVKTWLVMDVVIPGIKNTILDMLGMMFFGGGRDYSHRGRGRGYDKERVSYNSYYDSSRDRERDRRRDRRDGAPRDSKVDYKNIILKDRFAAEDLVNEMHRRIDDYNQVSIAEMFDILEVTGKYTDNNWGWTRKSDIGYRRVSSGYLIDVAEAEALDV